MLTDSYPCCPLPQFNGVHFYKADKDHNVIPIYAIIPQCGPCQVFFKLKAIELDHNVVCIITFVEGSKLDADRGSILYAD